MYISKFAFLRDAHKNSGSIDFDKLVYGTVYYKLIALVQWPVVRRLDSDFFQRCKSAQKAIKLQICTWLLISSCYSLYSLNTA